MEKTRFSQFTASELNTLAINLYNLTDINLQELKKELKKEIELKAENKYRHELKNINEELRKLNEKKYNIEMYLKIKSTKPTNK